MFENQDQIKGQVAVENAPAITNKVHDLESNSEIQKFWGAKIKIFQTFSVRKSSKKSYMGLCISIGIFFSFYLINYNLEFFLNKQLPM